MAEKSPDTSNTTNGIDKENIRQGNSEQGHMGTHYDHSIDVWESSGNSRKDNNK